ncbi:anthranilate synthase component II [Anaerotalea alkaliphila]|uniref:Aminodeoxychorismate/anthranilate synthase component II n=1 Tax=Anaerotalea alkaliphila TaxID=2662126 RepID=A0A7X5KNF0_9FIRM|nr:aminodeoxychorismate/anthranilate synthase component II [Anaerotalea alkaliphila]NDL67728.1 aminodeoxychorismate/anthranilate synthase component II [Anaerotalea alkaliphila]
MILLIDNYDSFTYNLYQYIGEFEQDILVVRNDAMTVEEIEALAPEKIVLSPGPKAPKDAGICMDVIRHFGGKVPILGVCLGHQCMGEAYGGKVVHAKRLVHGKSSVIRLARDPLFEGVGEEIQVARYHSLIVSKEGFPDCLEVLSQTGEEEIMAMKHKDFPVYGLQFHPESILTPEGKILIRNFIEKIH